MWTIADMPSLPSRPCRAYGCTAHAIPGRGYCADHAAIGTESRRAAHRAYDGHKRAADPALAEARRIRSTGQWARLSAWWLAQHPTCADPYRVHGELGALAQQVHHIRGLATHPELAFDTDNLASLCTRCHRRVEVDTSRGRPTAFRFTGQDLPT